MAAGLAVATVAMVSCSAGGASSPAKPPAAPDLTRFYGQQLAWGPCASFAPSSDDRAMYNQPRFDCAYLTVPVDYSQPERSTAQLAVLRQKASVPGQRVGSLVVNPGGEGSSGTETVAETADRPSEVLIRQRFDIVGFDPRGIGASKPAVQCLTPRERDAQRLEVEMDASPAGVERIETKAKDYAQKCLQRSGKDLLANIGARDVARDMDVLRAVLGEQKLTYLGYSYGTRLGTSYAEQFPNNVRAMVLDGALDPNQSLADKDVSTTDGFQRAFNAFAADCAKQRDCPLGADPNTANDTYRRLVLALIERPVPLADGRKLSYNDAIIGTTDMLYFAPLWMTLRLALQELGEGRGERLMSWADEFEGRQRDGSYDNWSDAYVPIVCADAQRVADPDQRRQTDARINQMSLFRDIGPPPIPARDICPFWPVPNTSQAHQPAVPGLPPVMVVSVTGDPATRYQHGVNLATALGARLLTVQGVQHTIAFGGTPCVDNVLSSYLISLTLPPDGAQCTIGSNDPGPPVPNNTVPNPQAVPPGPNH